MIVTVVVLPGGAAGVLEVGEVAWPFCAACTATASRCSDCCAASAIEAGLASAVLLSPLFASLALVSPVLIGTLRLAGTAAIGSPPNGSSAITAHKTKTVRNSPSS